jgi:hypothetical protein
MSNKLNVGQEANNIEVATSWLILWPFYLIFWIRINLNQNGPRGFAWPVHFAIDLTGHPPHAATRMLKSYGIASHSWGAMYHVVEGRQTLVEDIVVSSRQAAWADSLLHAGQFHTYSKQRSGRELQKLPGSWANRTSKNQWRKPRRKSR